VKEDGSYDSYLVFYDISQNEKNLLLEGIQLDLSDKIYFKKIEINLLQNLFKNSDTVQEAIYECPPGNCCEIIPDVSPSTGWDIYITTIIPCPSSDGGGYGGGGDSPSYPTNPGGEPSSNPNPAGDIPLGFVNYDGIFISNPTSPVTTMGEQPAYPDGSETASEFLINTLTPLSTAQKQWIEATENSAEVAEILDFLSSEGRKTEAKNFAISLIKSYESNSFEEFLNQSLFVQDPYNTWKNLTQAEKDLIVSFPYDAWAIWNNRPIAVQATISKFGFSSRNDKSDAFRHAYFNAINTMDVGSYSSEKFSTAHESENPSHLILEKQMDLFNNSIGHDVQINYPNHSDSQLIEDIYQELLDGNLRYLSPLDPVVYPNFGINSQTQLIPTDQ
jgi:hypothetical protein